MRPTKRTEARSNARRRTRGLARIPSRTPSRTLDRTLARTLPRTFTLVALGLALVLASAGDVAAQGHPHERQGFWVNGGLGYGSLGIEGFSEREDGLSGNLALGGTISPRFLLGAGTTGWTKEVDGIRVNFGTLLLLGRFYPNAEGGFFLNLGLGAGQVSLTEGNSTWSESGGGAVLGLGYDVRVGPNWSLTPFVNGIGFDIDGDRADVFQFGLGVSFH
jgi:hypothetical protein